MNTEYLTVVELEMFLQAIDRLVESRGKGVLFTRAVVMLEDGTSCEFAWNEGEGNFVLKVAE